MSVDVIMPKLGESITEGTILEWKKNVGDNISKDEALLEISTDPKELTKYIIPDFSHFKWQNESDNTLLEIAKELWGYK